MIAAMADSRSDDMGTAAAAERELTLTPAQALALAIERYRLDELDDAEMIYAALLERWTDRPDVLNYMGVLQHQRGENGAALALLRHAVEVAPDTALAPWRPGRLHRRSLARGRRRQPSLAPPAAPLTRTYLRSVLDGAGFVQQRIDADVLRSEGRLPVPGWLVSACRE